MFTISYKTKTKFISEILKQENINEIKKPSMFSKIGLGKKEFADIYFHGGALDKEAISNIENAKVVIVNSLTSKEELQDSLTIQEDKIKVLYPAVDIEYEKPKEVKKRVCEKLEIDPDKKIIFFTAKNFKSSGIIEFLNIIMYLNDQNFIAVILGDKKQTYNLRFQLSKVDIGDKILLLEDYENIDELFLASDVFLLPTHNKNFASNILKAMYCKCAVFTTVENAAKEVIDVFSTMESPSDRSMQFKLDALLGNKEDLKLIQKQNRKTAKKFTLEKQLDRFNNLLISI